MGISPCENTSLKWLHGRKACKCVPISLVELFHLGLKIYKFDFKEQINREEPRFLKYSNLLDIREMQIKTHHEKAFYTHQNGKKLGRWKWERWGVGTTVQRGKRPRSQEPRCPNQSGVERTPHLGILELVPSPGNGDDIIYVTELGGCQVPRKGSVNTALATLSSQGAGAFLNSFAVPPVPRIIGHSASETLS